MEEEREGKEETEGFLGVKLKRGVLGGKRGGLCTPPPTWSFGLPGDGNMASTSVSARQLGANLWEILPHLQSLARMSGGGGGGGVGVGVSRGRSHRGRQQHGGQGSKGLEMQSDVEEATGGQPASTGHLRRQIAPSHTRRHPSLQPPSPASYSGSMEVTPYNPAHTPTSSVEFKGRVGDSSYNIKTSTELLRVLNRIWGLEEQHASNISLVNALKAELDNSRARIKQLVQEKRIDRQIIDDLTKQVIENKHLRKNVEHERYKSALESAKEELEVERKLRKRSESLHRKLTREVSDTKLWLSKALNELERERKARVLLESLCDEFAIGIGAYEQEMISRKFQIEKDRLVLEMSEAWLEERMQMKSVREDRSNSIMIVEKFRPEIEAFVRARMSFDSRPSVDTNRLKESVFRRHSLESFRLNEATSAPRNANDDEESTDSESNCFELNKNDDGIQRYQNPEVKESEYTLKSNTAKSSSSLQERFERRISSRKTKPKIENPENRDKIQDDLPETSKRFGIRGPNPSHTMDKLLRNNSSSLDGERIHPESSTVDDSHTHFMATGPASPVKKWEDSEVLQSKWPTEKEKDNTLKAKLLEARLEGRRSRSEASKSKPEN